MEGTAEGPDVGVSEGSANGWELGETDGTADGLTGSSIEIIVLGVEGGFVAGETVEATLDPAEGCMVGTEEGTAKGVAGDPYPGGLRQFGAVGCKHCLLLQIAPGSQQSDAELQLLP